MQIRTNANDNQVMNVSKADSEQSARREGRKAQKVNRQTVIFAGEFGLQNDIITQRRQRAQRKAFKMISDAWNTDRKIDQDIAEIKDKLSLLHDEQRENLDIIAEGEGQKEALREHYKVDLDSQEQKDLKLLEKKADIVGHRCSPETSLTDEERERLEQLEEEPLTEYQRRCLEIDSYQGMYEKRNILINSQIQGYNASVTSIRLERLKFHGMVDAQKKADAVMEQAGKEITGLIVDEAKDHVDEEFEEKIEEAKENAEEKAKEEEKIEQRKEDQVELEARIDETREKSEEREEIRKEAEERSREDADLLGEMIDAGMAGIGSSSSMQTDIKNILHKMKLLEEDLKGNIVDEEL